VRHEQLRYGMIDVVVFASTLFSEMDLALNG
jgi:hypothetical protein